MNARMEYTGLTRIAPAVVTVLTVISKAVSDSGLDQALTELIEIRASQINGCAFCVQYHLNAARKLNLSEIKLGLVAVWHEANIFTARERAALAWDRSVDSRNARWHNGRELPGCKQRIL